MYRNISQEYVIGIRTDMIKVNNNSCMIDGFPSMVAMLTNNNYT